MNAPHPLSGSPGTGAGAPLTEVDLIWIEGVVEHWIRFGRPADEAVIDRQRRTLSFAPGAVFAFVRWASNDFGTIVSRIDVVRAVTPSAPHQALPHVRPGGESLLRLSGWPKVERVMQTIDAIETAGIAPSEVSPDHWRHVHNRLSANETPRPYTSAQHSAWRLRRRMGA